MKYCTFLILYLIPNIIWAQCQYYGNHKLFIEVLSCDVNSDIHTSGVAIKGRVIESDFALASHVKNQHKEELTLKVGKIYDFFLPNATLKSCRNITQKTFKAESIFKCCDTLPAKGVCLVPINYIKIKPWR